MKTRWGRIFDQAFARPEPITEVLERILQYFEVDIYQERQGSFTVRVWDGGATIIEVTNLGLDDAIRDADRNAAVYVNQC